MRLAPRQRVAAVLAHARARAFGATQRSIGALVSIPRNHAQLSARELRTLARGGCALAAVFSAATAAVSHGAPGSLADVTPRNCPPLARLLAGVTRPCTRPIASTAVAATAFGPRFSVDFASRHCSTLARIDAAATLALSAVAVARGVVVIPRGVAQRASRDVWPLDPHFDGLPFRHRHATSCLAHVALALPWAPGDRIACARSAWAGRLLGRAAS
eukprot:636364-Prymnesium_polylepis.1